MIDQTAQLKEENQRLRKAVEELSILNDLSRVISSTMNLDEVIENVVKRSVRAIQGQQGMITLVDEQSPMEMKTLVRTQDSTTDHQRFHLNQNILGWMLINKKPLLSNDLSGDSRFSGVRLEGEVRSLLCVPLLAKNRLIGILAVFNKKENAEFSEDDKRLLSIIATQSAQILENARLYEQERSLLSIQAQVKLAANIQSGLLPNKMPEIAGFDISGRSSPAQEVGGDYFDFIVTEEGKLAICLGDVSGKGLPASLLMANLQATLRGQALVSKSAQECLIRSNRLLYESTSPEKFVTLFYGILDPSTSVFHFSNAGHDNPILIPAAGGAPCRLSTGGTVLAIMDYFPYSEETITFAPGDLLLIYSDGVPEAMNANGEFFGEDRILEILAECRGLRAVEVIDKIVMAAKAFAGSFPQSDDMTLIVVRRT